jgi:hypothetical protein
MGGRLSCSDFRPAAPEGAKVGNTTGDFDSIDTFVANLAMLLTLPARSRSRQDLSEDSVASCLQLSAISRCDFIDSAPHI